MTTARARAIAGVPVLLAEPLRVDGPRRTVLWFHGFRADALAHAGELERCAAMGFLAVGVDAVGHGARVDVELPARLAAAGRALPVMLEQVEATVRELPALVDELVQQHGAERSRVSAVGISMGAFLAYRAVVAGPPLRAVVALLGSPEWEGDASAHRSLAAFRDVALLSITAEHDESVPPAPARRLHASLDAAYGTTARQEHVELRGSGHLTSAERWAEAMGATMAWLQRYG